MQTPTFQKIQSGSRRPTANTEKALAKGLGVQVADLYAEIGSPIPPPPESFISNSRHTDGLDQKLTEDLIITLFRELDVPEQEFVVRIIRGLLASGNAARAS